ncbi:MAG: class I SAM-dependent methyltransferase [Acidimicrobiia bacterium]
MLRSIASRARQALSRYLVAVFRATERLNRDAILETLSGEKVHSLLDCGCGDGGFTLELARQVGAERVFGVEWDSSRAEAAREKGIAAVRADLNGPLPFDDQVFDVVHSNQVLEHLYSTDTFLRESRRVLKPGGIVILSTNNLSSWHNVVSLILGMQPPPMHVSGEVIAGNTLDPLRGTRHPTVGDSHLRLFSFKGLRELCEYHRYTVKVLKGVGYYPLPPRLSKLATRVDRWHGAFLVAALQRSEQVPSDSWPTAAR